VGHRNLPRKKNKEGLCMCGFACVPL